MNNLSPQGMYDGVEEVIRAATCQNIGYGKEKKWWRSHTERETDSHTQTRTRRKQTH